MAQKNTEFPVNTYRFDPYLNFKFQVKWDNRFVAGISKVSGLSRTTHTVTFRPGGDPGVGRRIPGQTEFSPITLERGVTHDMAFEQWANKVWCYHNSTQTNPQQIVSLQDFRKDSIEIHMLNEAGQTVLIYYVYRCWVSEWNAVPELNGNGNEIAIQSIVLENEGWERDIKLKPPKQPSFVFPPNS